VSVSISAQYRPHVGCVYYCEVLLADIQCRFVSMIVVNFLSSASQRAYTTRNVNAPSTICSHSYNNTESGTTTSTSADCMILCSLYSKFVTFTNACTGEKCCLVSNCICSKISGFITDTVTPTFLFSY